MVHLKSAKKNTFDWPFKINIKLPNRDENRLAFMTTQSRTFSDPGVSRFGIYYSLNCAPGDVPNPNYYPVDNYLQKPTSTKGYGMGGLSGPRFLKLHLANNPAPNAYQKETTHPPPKRKSAIRKLAKKKKLSAEEDEFEKAPLPPPPMPAGHKEHLRRLCLQKYIGFGTHLTVNRFGREASFHNVGVGYYDLRKRREAQLQVTGSFGQKPVKLIPSTVTRCNYMGYDRCFECEEVLSTVDYYRTWKKIPNPLHNPAHEGRVVTNDSEDSYYRVSVDASTPSNLKHIFVSLCRKCYCRGMRGESHFWDSAQLPVLFHKTRHCTYIHDHRNIPIFTHKTLCKYVHKVRMKEALMAKYYKDECERVLREK